MARKNTLVIGSYSSGTLRTQDLLQAMADALDPLHLSRSERAHVREAYRLLGAAERELPEEDAHYKDQFLLPHWTPEEEEAAEYLVNEDLPYACDAHCPPYTYWGAHPGDSSDIGVWVDWECLEGDAHAGDVLQVTDTSDVPSGYSGYVLQVNDHGNATLYQYTRGRAREVWAVV